MEQLTVKEALEQGYKYAKQNSDEWGHLYKISELTLLDFNESEMFGQGLVLCSKEVHHYGIAEDTVFDLISDHIADQDEMSDEDCELPGIALEGCDDLLKQLTEKINENLSKKDFYFQTEIKLVPWIIKQENKL